ncbi:MAG TPA: protein-glutamate O-methyltransferase CheR, partial [Brevibacterium sp.]|nr:protein-glutamate O-methyltransferase CheR [Brevibacterium sp.]
MVAWSDPGYAAVIREVHERAGLVFSPARRTSVENTIYRAMLRAGASDSTLFAERIRADAALRNALIGELTVGESYFFRDPSQFTLIEREIVPDLLARRGPDAPLRVWSAGCASGEEPYSLAILFERMGQAGRARITGTEISAPRLEAARHARYGRWALRGVPTEIVDACFEPNGRHFDLAPRLRDAVEFRRLNLAEDAYPAPEQGLAELDLILCRNVLIYFDLDTVRAVAARLLASLAE